MQYLVLGPWKSLTKWQTTTDRKVRVPNSQSCTGVSRVQHFLAPDVFLINLCMQVCTDTRTQGQNSNINKKERNKYYKKHRQKIIWKAHLWAYRQYLGGTYLPVKVS